jgi:hypothetical protein
MDITFLGLCFTILLAIMVFSVRRQFVPIPMFIAACYMTLEQGIEIATMHFSVMRIIIFISWVRLILRGEIISFKLNAIDKGIIFYVVSAIVTYTFLYQTTDALINRLGFAYNAIGLYFLFRFYIQNLDDVQKLLKIIAIILLPLAIFMLYENATGWNCFSIFGGVPEFSEIRDGSVRCQGAFRHPILAGTFGATIMPLMVSLWWQKGSKILSFCAVAAAIVIVFTAKSSGPLIASVAGIVGLFAWYSRGHMRIFRWGIIIGIIMLSLIMKAPWYYVMARASDVIGGGGWHRAYLLEQAMNHLGKWWMIGAENTGDWMPTTLLSGQADITNQFISVGVHGGLITLIFFIAVIVLCFSKLGLLIE